MFAATIRRLFNGRWKRTNCGAEKVVLELSAGIRVHEIGLTAAAVVCAVKAHVEVADLVCVPLYKLYTSHISIVGRAQPNISRLLCERRTPS